MEWGSNIQEPLKKHKYWVAFLGIDHLHLAVKEVGSHEKLKGNFRRNRELGDLGGGIGVPDMQLDSI